MRMKKLIYCSTIPTSINLFCRGLLRELSSKYEVVVVSSPGEELDEIAQREQVRCVPIKMHREIAPLADERALVYAQSGIALYDGGQDGKCAHSYSYFYGIGMAYLRRYQKNDIAYHRPAYLCLC